MTKNTKKIDTALVGCGYWGTNIAKSLIPIKEAIYVFDVNKNNTKIKIDDVLDSMILFITALRIVEGNYLCLEKTSMKNDDDNGKIFI